ncbi:MAG TPA: amidohydrolase family protein [Thermoanaerobaculia bacterium]|nr:amidohydrolase family protein [Thermoanaerobaculia bacterium]
MILRRSVAIVLLFLAAPLLFADAPGVYAITGGTVHPVSGPDIPNGTVVIRNGLIESVGSGVSIPSDATVIDVKGAHIYPGLIDAQTFLGFTTPKRGDKSAEPTPDALAVRNAKISDDDASAGRNLGVTTVLTAPTSGIFNGQSAIINLGSGPIESRVIKSPASTQIAFNTRPTWTYPDSLMGVMSYIRQELMDAQQHQAARSLYERSPAGLRRPADDAQLEALQPALTRQLPVVFVADSASMIRRAQTLAKEFNLKLIIAGARQAYQMPDELKGVPLLVSVKWDTAPTDKEDREDQPLRVIRDRQLQPTTPSVLAKAGVEFALVSSPGKAGDYFGGIRKAIENGLTAEQALRATTLAPARIFGIERQLGSLERGKIANVIVSDKPIFEKASKVTRVFIDGREMHLPAEEKKAAATAAAPIDGTWALTVRAPQGNVSMSVTLKASDGKLAGTFSGDRGSGEIRGGSIDGTAFEFTISANAQNEAEATDWLFKGTLAESNMTGTVSTTLGTFEFSGSKSE